MNFIRYDSISGKILGLSTRIRFIKEQGWVTGTKKAHDYIIENNGYCKIDINSIQEKLKKYNNTLTNIEDLKNKDLINNLPIVIDVENVVMIEDTLQETISSKIRHNNTMCNMMITAGILFEVNNEVKHFSFKSEDQINYTELFNLVNNNILKEVLIKPNEEDEYINISANKFKELYLKLIQNKYYHLYYLKELNKYVKSLTDKITIEKIQYEDILPEPYKTNLDEKMKLFKEVK